MPFHFGLLSVLLDIFTRDPHWARWSEEKLAFHAERDLLAINPIIYAEVSAHFSTMEELDEVPSVQVIIPGGEA